MIKKRSKRRLSSPKRKALAESRDLKKRLVRSEIRNLKKRRTLAESRDLKMAGRFVLSRHSPNGETMEKLRIYKVTDHYVRYLHGVDDKVQYNKNARRPYVGIVFEFAGFRYFVPMESPKPNHENIKSGKHILRLDGGKYGILGFNNMIPVHKDALITYDIDKEPDLKYRELLRRQAEICNRMKADILDHAQKTYFDVTGKSNKFLMRISCDFKKLERACKGYDKDHKPKKASPKKVK